MDSIKDAVKGIMRELELKKAHPVTSEPEALFKKALTKRELEHIKFNYFKKGVLGARVDSSSWLYQFNLEKEGLLARLKKQFTGIKDIRLRLGG